MSAQRRGERFSWLEGAAFAALVGLVLAIGGETLRTSYHGLMHATLGETVLRDGLLPENPYHAGEPLRYYTLYPLLGSLLGRLGIGTLWGFALLAMIAALLFPPALDRLGRAFGLGFVGRRAAFLSAFFGFNGLGWLGLAFLEGSFTFGDSPAALLARLTFVAPDSTLGFDGRLLPLVAKFLNVSSYAIALPFALWFLARVADATRDVRVSPWPAAPALGLSVALNPLVGGFAAICGALWIAPLLLRGTEDVAGSRSLRFAWPLAGVLSAAVALPFLVPLLQPAATGESLQTLGEIHGHPLRNLLGPLLLLWVPGALGLARLAPHWRWRIGVGVVIAATFVLARRMPWANEYKFVRLLGVLLAIPVGAWIEHAWLRGRGTRALLIGLWLVTLPSTVVVLATYLRWERAPLPIVLDAGRMAIAPESSAPGIGSRILEAARVADPSDVFLVHPYVSGFAPGPEGILESRAVLPLSHGHPLAPLLNRPLAVDLPHFQNNRLPGYVRRVDRCVALWHGHSSPLSPERRAIPARRALQKLREEVSGRGLLVLTSSDLPPIDGLLRSAGGELLVQESRFALWRVPPLATEG